MQEASKYVVSDEEDFEMENAKSSSDSGEEFSNRLPRKQPLCAVLYSLAHCFSAVPTVGSN